MRGTTPLAPLGEARRAMARLADEVRRLEPGQGAAWSPLARQRLFRLVLEACDGLAAALCAAEVRLADAVESEAVRRAAANLAAVEQLIWHPLEGDSGLLARWIHRRSAPRAWEVDYLGLEYHFDRQAHCFVNQLLAWDRDALRVVLMRLEPPAVTA